MTIRLWLLKLAIAGLGLVSPLTGPKSETFPVRLKAPSIRTLIVGGGPDAEHNQVAIESNVRYVNRVLPEGSETRVLFADGNPRTKDVQYLASNSQEAYRAPKLPRMDGPAELTAVSAELRKLSSKAGASPGTPVLLYFTGHGSPNPESNFDDNSFDLWNEEELQVKPLASMIARFPKQTPITVVMVQCFAGAFGNLVFDGGDPGAEFSGRNICGFFSSVAESMAAGCTPEVNEEDYHDFTGYFFAALSGTDRMGRKITDADFNGDGQIGMDEAFDYSLLHDDSIDTPVCTSDVFLRRFVKTADRDVFSTPYSTIHAWANRGQTAVLDGLSDSLGLLGEDRASRAYERLLKLQIMNLNPRDAKLIRFVRTAKSVVLRHEVETGTDARLRALLAGLLAEEHANPLRQTSI